MIEIWGGGGLYNDTLFAACCYSVCKSQIAAPPTCADFWRKSRNLDYIIRAFRMWIHTASNCSSAAVHHDDDGDDDDDVHTEKELTTN